MRNYTKHYTSLLLLFFLVGQAYAQMFSADNDYSQKSLQEAIKKYLKTVEADPYNGEALFNLANSYRLNSEFRKAEIWFSKAVQIEESPESYLYYAQMLLSNGKYIEAATWFKRYAVQESGTSNEKNALKLADYAQKLAEEGLENKDYLITKAEFNSDRLDFSPMYYQDSSIVFASNRKDGNNEGIDRWTNQYYVDLYLVNPGDNEDEKWQKPTPFSKQINTKLHEGPVTFNKYYDVMYFTRNDLGRKGRGFDSEKNTRLKIFQSQLEGEGWTNPIELPFNNKEYHCAHPALAKDTTYMVFASDMPGGYGQMDLYIAWLQDGEWGEPTNLGSEINTSGNEVFPYLDENGQLYFSSDLHVGLGGLDIFSAEQRTGNNQALGQWYNPTNMGAPLNGNRDDFGMIINQAGTTGYFTSNRSGKGDDIYHFEIDGMIRIAGTVINCKDSTEIGAANVVVRSAEGEEIATTRSNADGSFAVRIPRRDLYNFKATKEGFGFCAGGCDGTASIDLKDSKNDSEIRVLLSFCPADPCQLTTRGPVLNNDCDKPIAGAKVTLVNKCTGERQSMTTGEDGYYSFDLDEDCEYIVVAEKEGFFRKATEFTTTAADCGDLVESEVPMDFDNSEYEELLGNYASIEEGTVIELYNVYFDLDKYNIRPDAQTGLNDVYQLMIDYPEMKGEIGAHTDSRAPFKYNETLSDNRAKSARDYLIKRGISADRITWKGYGEYVLKNECADDVECTEFQHQRNRRVEFKVTYFEGTVNSKEYESFRIGDKASSRRN